MTHVPPNETPVKAKPAKTAPKPKKPTRVVVDADTINPKVVQLAEPDYFPRDHRVPAIYVVYKLVCHTIDNRRIYAEPGERLVLNQHEAQVLKYRVYLATPGDIT